MLLSARGQQHSGCQTEAALYFHSSCPQEYIVLQSVLQETLTWAEAALHPDRQPQTHNWCLQVCLTGRTKGLGLSSAAPERFSLTVSVWLKPSVWLEILWTNFYCIKCIKLWILCFTWQEWAKSWFPVNHYCSCLCITVDSVNLWKLRGCLQVLNLCQLFIFKRTNSFHIYRNDDDQDFNVLEEHGWWRCAQQRTIKSIWPEWEQFGVSLEHPDRKTFQSIKFRSNFYSSQCWTGCF